MEEANTNKKPRSKRLAKTVTCVIACVFAIPILLTAALYIPAVQNWAVGIASRYASEAIGMEIKVAQVRLAFPLDLSLERVSCIKPNDSLPQLRDTIALVERTVVDVKLLPLFSKEVKLNKIELVGARINTADIIHEARIKGSVGRLALEKAGSSPLGDIYLKESNALLGKVLLQDSHLNIELADTVPEDTTKSENKWKIWVTDIAISHSDVLLHMPGDTLQIGATLEDVKARNGEFDLEKQQYSLGWLSMNNGALRYDNNFAITNSGFDPNHISINDIQLRVDSIYYCSPDMKLRITECKMKEKSGLTLQSCVAAIAMDSTKIEIDGSLKTPSSSLYSRVKMDLNAFDETHPGRVQAYIDSQWSLHDLLILAPQLTNGASIGGQWKPLNIKADVEGNLKQVRLPYLSVEMPTAFALSASGNAQGFMSLADNPYSNDFAATIHADLRTYNMNFVKSLMDKATAKTINIPSMTAIADINAHGADYAINLKAKEGKGTVKAKAQANIANMSYDAAIDANRLNLSHFVRGMHLGNLTGSITAKGNGTDILSKRTTMTANADIRHFGYDRYDINNVKADAVVRNGRANVDIVSKNELIDGNITLQALMNTKSLQATLATELNTADLLKLHFVEVPVQLSLCAHVDISSDFKECHELQGLISDITIIDTTRNYRPDDIVLDMLTRPDTTTAKVDCGDFMLRLYAQGGYKKLLGISDKLLATIERQFNDKTINQEELRDVLPTMKLQVHSSQSNPIYRFVKYYDFDYRELDINLDTSKENGINGDFAVSKLLTQGYELDTINFTITSTNDPDEIRYKGRIKNLPPNEYVFDALFDGKVLEHGFAIGTVFYDKNHEVGLRIGTEATMEADGINFHLSPASPIIAYKPFNLNTDNHVLLKKNGRIDADVVLTADDGTGIQLYSENEDTEEAEDGDTEENALSEILQDLTLSVKQLNMERLLSAIPYAPRVTGALSGDVHFVQETDKDFTISSNLSMQKMTYEGCNIGNLGTEITYMPKSDGSHYLDGSIMLEEKEIGNISGSYNFDTEEVDANLTFNKFPMELANGFIPDKIIGLEGTAEGELTLRGTTDLPDINGELFLESASLISEPYGVRMRFDDDPVTISNSKLLFENFQMYSNNNQPLILQGNIDFADMEHIKMNMRMRAEKFLLIDAKETARSEAYGKAFINLFTSLNGELDKLKMRGRLEILPSTNLYYILKDSPLTTDNRLKELVTFTDLNGDQPIVVQRPTVDGLDVNLTIAVDNGSHIKCWLNNSHSNYVDIIGEGDMRLKYNNQQMTLTGNYTINQGEMKYSLPVIPLKTFTITQGSFLQFTGDVTNPTLDITAKETTKASVNIEGTSQMVTFNTGVRITKTLKDMGLQFLIEAPENQTVSDELSMKSVEERGKLAVTMLTTGMYLSDGNTSAFSMNSALNSFLQSEINNIAGNALHSIDLSFGMDNSTEEDGTMHTNYSFKFAKRFWNNRIAISVGGKISTGPDVSGQNKSFFDNVEVQYRTSETSNQYLQLFYKNSVYDFLEGYVGQYGAGWLWKKKAQTIKEIFKGSSRTAIRQPSDNTRVIRNAKSQ